MMTFETLLSLSVIDHVVSGPEKRGREESRNPVDVQDKSGTIPAQYAKQKKSKSHDKKT